MSTPKSTPKGTPRASKNASRATTPPRKQNDPTIDTFIASVQLGSKFVLRWRLEAVVASDNSAWFDWTGTVLEKGLGEMVVRYDHDLHIPRMFPPPPQANGVMFRIDPSKCGPVKPLQCSDLNLGAALIWEDPPKAHTPKRNTKVDDPPSQSTNMFPNAQGLSTTISMSNVLPNALNLNPTIQIPSATHPAKRSREEEVVASMLGAVSGLTSAVGSLVAMQASQTSSVSHTPSAMFDPITMDSGKFAEETKKTASQTMITKRVLFGDITVPKNIPKDHYIFYPHIWIAQLHVENLGLSVVKSNLAAALSILLSRYKFHDIARVAITAAQETFEEWLGLHALSVPSSESAWRLGILCLQPIFTQYIFASRLTNLDFATSSIRHAGCHLNYHDAEIAKK